MVRNAIALITEQQRELDRRAGSAYAGVAVVERELRSQRAMLAAAVCQVDAAITAAERAAESGRADGGEPAAAPYERTAAGLRAQRAVLVGAAEQLETLRGGTERNAERTAELLTENRQRLRAALDEQLTLLRRFEELERRRAIGELRRRRR